MHTLDSKIQSEELQKAFVYLQKRKFNDAQKILEQGLQKAAESGDTILEALFYSTFGILYKLKEDFRLAWKYYEKAEKLVPQDPALKIVTSHLLIEHFKQFDIVLRKMKKIEPLVQNKPIFHHQMICLKGLAYLGKGNKYKAVELLQNAMQDSFKGLVSSANIDFKLMAALLAKKLALDEARLYLGKALDFAKHNKEKSMITIIQTMLQDMPTTIKD